MRNVGTVPNKLNDGQILFLRSFLLILLFIVNYLTLYTIMVFLRTKEDYFISE